MVFPLKSKSFLFFDGKKVIFRWKVIFKKFFFVRTLRFFVGNLFSRNDFSLEVYGFSLEKNCFSLEVKIEFQRKTISLELSSNEKQCTR